ncbi:CHAT domain-containing protein [Spirosoma terrae]|uniref:CHAT domain-containing protein n=1 Tax=Spirosoma terrae TaxID=1968276 RepID=A0A6L9LBB1_9BACT|nr:CHAT domain-containing tetratricopeptide repeat protein [Spirosoma terrae]NDU96692.1 CHAT domain-containing protein [Spirosoma terrae]
MPTLAYFRFFTLIILFLLTIDTHAQNWKQQIDHIDSLYSSGQTKQAYELSKLSQLQAEREYGTTHTNYGVNLCFTGQLLQELGDLTQAEPLIKQGIQVIKQSSKPDGEDYSYAITVIGRLYGAMNKITESLFYLNEALQVRRRLYGIESNEYAEILGVLSLTHSSMGQYEQAIAEMQQVLSIRSKLYGQQHPLYGESASTLGSMYIDLDDYVKAEPLLEDALRIRGAAFGTDNINYWFTANNLAALKSRMGDYAKAISIEQDLLNRMKVEHQQTAVYLSTLNLLAGDYFHIKQYQKSDSVYAVAQTLVEKVVGKNHLRYSENLEGQTLLHEQLGELEEAERLCREAVDVCQRSIGIQNDPYLSKANRLARIYVRQGQYIKADSIYAALIPLSDQVIGHYSVSSAKIRSDQLASYHAQQRADKAVPMLIEASLLNEATLKQQMPYWTSIQQERYLLKHMPAYWSNLSAAVDVQKAKDVSAIIYQQSLFFKNLLLTQQTNSLSAILSANNPAWLTTYRTVQDIKSTLATQYTLPISQRKNLDSLETRAETLEKELARQSAPFRQAQKDLQVRWEDIRNALKPTEAAVEFVSFPYHNGHQQTDTIRYLALVVRPGDTSPQLVPLLADEMPLRQLLARRKGATLYATRGSEIDNEQLSQGDSLYRLIWQPIEHLLTNTKTVYVSPSGLLHQVAFAALPYPKKSGKTPQYLIDRYQLKQVSSTRQVATQATDFNYENIHSAQLYGGIQYDSAGTATSGSWAFLPGTQHEVEQISQFIGAKATLMTGSNATETSIKRASGQSPTVLHLATHGFSFPNPSVLSGDTSSINNRFQRIANPLFRTGLLMAGANPVWQGGQIPLGKDDGILTAYEVANLNLSSTKLVVLSACETALGDIQGSEGVFGLQRAFKMAGTQYLLMSLWPVSDQATSSLMTQFYRNWKKYKTVRQAFQQTQKQMRQKFPLTVWASFVLVE